MEDCVFCEMTKGKMPIAKIYENEHVLAFLDINQVTEGHTLVIPKQHVQDIYSLTPEIAGQIYSAIPEIAKALKKSLRPMGLNLLNNNGMYAGQSVFHYHVHLIPRYDENDGFDLVWRPNQGKNLDKLATKIKEVIE